MLPPVIRYRAADHEHEFRVTLLKKTCSNRSVLKMQDGSPTRRGYPSEVGDCSLPQHVAKLGTLFLHNGLWDGQQIVSAQSVENATRSHTETDGDRGYGYQWWTAPSLGAYTALGLYGQTIMVIPGSELVIVTTAQMENHDKIFQLIEQYIVPAMKN